MNFAPLSLKRALETTRNTLCRYPMDRGYKPEGQYNVSDLLDPLPICRIEMIICRELQKGVRWSRASLTTCDDYVQALLQRGVRLMMLAQSINPRAMLFARIDYVWGLGDKNKDPLSKGGGCSRAIQETLLLTDLTLTAAFICSSPLYNLNLTPSSIFFNHFHIPLSRQHRS